MLRIRFLISGPSLVVGLKSICMWLALFMASNLFGQRCAAEDAVRESVVKIQVTRVKPDYFRPLERTAPQELGGTGVIIDDNRILTNAHVVGHARTITVQGFRSAEKVTAKVIGISKGQDLAVLSVDDDNFFKDRPALQFLGELPAVKDHVSAYGFPVGGKQISVTEGIVSRIEYSKYYLGTQGLRIQVDAALNPGNSGGPVVKDGKLVGVVFSKIKEADNIGYLIPIEEIRLFLNDIKDGSYDGKLVLSRRCQTLENEAIRKKLGLSEEVGGVMVSELIAEKVDPDDNVLRSGDVITKIKGEAIDREGMVTIEDGHRVGLAYLIQKHADNDRIKLTLLRDGEEVEMDIRLKRGNRYLAKSLGYNDPRYIVVGPMVFTPVTLESAKSMAQSKVWPAYFSLKQSPFLPLAFSPRTDENEDTELVTVGRAFLPHPITQGYSEPNFALVKTFNDVEVKSLKHLVELMRDCQEEYFVFKFAGVGYETYVFEREKYLAATEEVLDDNGIRRQGTPELLKIWNSKPLQ